MYPEKRRMHFILLLVLAVAVTVLALTLRAQEQQSLSPKEQQSHDNPYPVVEFLAAESTQHEKDSKRRAKGKRYDKGSVVKDGAGLQQANLFNDWSFTVTELPINLSDIVIVATVHDAQAYLSPDKTGVYSEFNVKVDEVLKDLSASVRAGDSVAVSRQGGRVRYPSGDDVTYYIAGQSVPRVNKRYALFLKREEENLSILTGYELHEGKVRPLDHAVKFKKFEGANEVSLLNQIRRAVASVTSGTPGAGRQP